MKTTAPATASTAPDPRDADLKPDEPKSKANGTANGTANGETNGDHASERRQTDRRQNRRPRARPAGDEEVMVIREPGLVGYDRYKPGPLLPWEVRGKTLYSGVSAGTEMTIFRGSNVYAHKRWDASLKLFLPQAAERPFYPAVVGYEEVGFITEVGPEAQGVKVGDVVWGSWGHRTEFVMRSEDAARSIMPTGLDPRAGIFARIGAISLNGILDAGIHVGETAAVFGAGIVGLLSMALSQLSGARVYGVDINPAREHHARRYADEFITRDAALTIKQWTGGRGADVVIEATGNYAALQESIRAVAYAGKVVSLGFYQGNSSTLQLGEEFHHNRVRIICSQIFNVPPEVSFRWDVARLEKTIMALQAANRLDLMSLITQEIPFDEAASAYSMLENYTDTTLQIALTFPDAIQEHGRMMREKK